MISQMVVILAWDEMFFFYESHSVKLAYCCIVCVSTLFNLCECGLHKSKDRIYVQHRPMRLGGMCRAW